MQGGSQHDEAVPKHVMEVELLPDVEDNSRRVSNTPRQQQPHRAGRECPSEIVEDDKTAPADGAIKDERQPSEMLRYEQLEANADQRRAPDEGQHKATRRAARDQRQHRRVGSCDEKKDRGLIQSREEAFDGRHRRHVERQRHDENGKQRADVDNERRNFIWRGPTCRHHEERGPRGQCDYNSQPMHGAVANDLSAGIWLRSMPPGVVDRGRLGGGTRQHENSLVEINADTLRSILDDALSERR